VALSFRFPPDPQNGFSVDELNPRQNMAFWDRDLCVPGAKTPDRTGAASKHRA
jgi:hypothetical protein